MNQFELDGIVQQLESNAPEKVYIAAITQTSTATPSLSVMKNTTGTTVTASYLGVGAYRIVFAASTMTASKTFLSIGALAGSRAVAKITVSNAKVARIYTASGTTGEVYASVLNALVTRTPFEIRVY